MDLPEGNIVDKRETCFSGSSSSSFKSCSANYLHLRAGIERHPDQSF